MTACRRLFGRTSRRFDRRSRLWRPASLTLLARRRSDLTRRRCLWPASHVDVYGTHHSVSERTGLRAVEVDIDPDPRADPVSAAAGVNVALVERGSELVALLAGQAQLGGAGGTQAVGCGAS